MTKYAIYFQSNQGVTGKGYNDEKRILFDGYVKSICNDGTIKYCASKKDALQSFNEQAMRTHLNKVRKYETELCKFSLFRFEG